SVKLSALSPRYDALQEGRGWSELYPRLKRLAVIAARYDLNFTIDAEEADRLVLSLKLLDRLAREPDLGDWRGLGVAVQAYQKRAPETVARVADLARRTGRRLMVRLVKGAYWDTEIKKAQVAGRPDYPVWTTKAATDVNYMAAARAIIDASPALYGQFATHNAQSLAAVQRMAAEAGVAVEFQRLHGMGEALYAGAEAKYGPMTLRAYAPVGGHEDLLPYLVRRLLENGANTSFVHALLDDEVAPERVVSDPVAALEAHPDRHPKIAPPPGLYGAGRLNSSGRDLSAEADRERMLRALNKLDAERIEASVLIRGQGEAPGLEGEPVRAPADRARIVGQVRTPSAEAAARVIDLAVAAGREAQPAWDAKGGYGRARTLRAMADGLERDYDRLAALAVREAGKSWTDAVGEVREAIDFLRYYAQSAERLFGPPEVLTGPVAELNTLELHGRGVFAAISPWNFPLAIFTGQVAAALAAGNAVVAKPAEQTPLIAHEAVRLFHRAGLDPRLLSLIPGAGETVGAALVTHPGIDGVAFTGGTDTARAINRALADRPGAIIPFIAETGGLNGMFVDTTALREQVVDDVVVSAFGSAGQRCSALRLLYLPADTADLVIEGLTGAMDALVVGDPADPSVDVGPVIDEEARAGLERHLERLKGEARILRRAPVRPQDADGGVFFAPTLAEIPSPGWLEKEVFGPVLHVCRYDPERLDQVADALASKGYGLTLGVHSRIDGFAERVRALVPAGNAYVNRTVVGAVVGVQPFGGEGLSGTGPKAGGPYALLRYAVERAVSVNIAAQGGDPALLNLGGVSP
ncbi:MAG: bifunctional proline dehydrogenase/L-glutamate gamma-semialdehyde dehydrogenase PutA, partial [Caulobacteraceae bacterium]|nr:bifunctional proline dehydrogenase/L-glutamate gamma-semialdehyde dehydrogenase PutA [Caulobacter sp.]